MTLANFKSLVAGYVNRTAASLTSVNSQDILLDSINTARRAAQRDHTFELNRFEDAYLTTSAAGAAWTTGCKTTPGGATAVLMRRVDEVWNYSTATIGATTYYPRTTRIDFSYSGQFKREMVTVSNNQSVSSPQDYYVQNKFAYATGVNLYVTTVVDATETYKLVGIKWLDDLADGDAADIFLTYYTDWLKWATLAQLNVYLKDNERFPVDMQVMNRAWESVKQHDGSISNMGESTSLD